MDQCLKPIYPVLPSVINASREINEFLEKGRIFFQDEVTFARALTKVCNTTAPSAEYIHPDGIDQYKIREVVTRAGEGYLSPGQVGLLLDAAGIRRPAEAVVNTLIDAVSKASSMGFPLVMKVVGPLHKSDVGGVILGIRTVDEVKKGYSKLMNIKDAEAVLLQTMHTGIELFAGAKAEPGFGHLVLCGLGGIFVELLKDVQAGLSPLSQDEALAMIRSLRGVKILEGARGREETSTEAFAEVIWRLSALVSIVPEIREMDLNPLLGSGKNIIAVDARVLIGKQG
jgi:hypothetical protein